MIENTLLHPCEEVVLNFWQYRHVRNWFDKNETDEFSLWRVCEGETLIIAFKNPHDATFLV